MTAIRELVQILREVREKLALTISVIPEDLIRRFRTALFITTLTDFFNAVDSLLSGVLSRVLKNLREAEVSDVFSESTKQRIGELRGHLESAKSVIESVSRSLMLKVREPHDVSRLREDLSRAEAEIRRCADELLELKFVVPENDVKYLRNELERARLSERLLTIEELWRAIVEIAPE